MKGLQFTLTDGGKVWHDPVDIDEFKELSDNESYRFYIGGGLYELEKRRVKSVDFYDLCEECLCDLNSEHRSTCSMKED